MEGINKLASTISISDSLNVSIDIKVNRYVYIGEEAQDIARVSVEFNYTCDKLLGKCFDNFEIVLNIEGGEGIPIYFYINKFKYEGKISGRIKDKIVYVDIERGRGGGRIAITYTVKVKPMKIGRYSVSIGLFYIDKKGVKERIGDIIEVVFDVIKPIIINQLWVEPEADVYVIGDSLKLVLKVSSEYEGTINLLCRGAVKELVMDFDIKRGSNIFKVDSVISNPSDNVEVLLSIPKIGFKEVVRKELVVKKERFCVNDIKLGEPRIGNEFRLHINLENISRLGETQLVIEGKIYGFSVREKVVLKPRERKSLELKTPILTKDSITNLDGMLSILDTISNQLTSQYIKLPKPMELPIRIELAANVVQIYSGKVYELQLYVINESDKDVVVFPMRISSNLCAMYSKPRVEVHSFTSSLLSIPLKPLSLGDELATIDIAIEVNGSIVDVRQITFSLKVVRSFNIKRDEVKLLYPSKNVYAVKGQRIEIGLVVEVLSDYIDLTVDSNDIQVDDKLHRLYNPGGVITIRGMVNDYKNGISISISDGLIKEVVNIPLKVEKPSIEYKLLIRSRYFIGLRRAIDMELVNKFEVPLTISIEFTKLNGIEISDKNKHIEISIEPLKKHRLSIEFIYLTIGKASAKFNICSRYVDKKSGSIIDTWSKEDFFEVIVENPIDVDIKQYSNKVLLPYPVIDKVKDVKVDFKLDVVIKNVADTELHGIEIRVDASNMMSMVRPPKVELININEKFLVNIVVKIPIGTTLDELILSISISIDGFTIFSRSIKVGIERYPYTVLEIPRTVFNEAQCTYPTYPRGDAFIVMFPILEKNVDVCGEPTSASKIRHKVIQLLYEKLNEFTKTISSYESPWEIAASIIFKKTIGTLDNHEYYNYLESIAPSKGSILVVPSYLWYITILKLLSISRDTSTGLIRSESVGLIYTENSIIYRSTNTLYGYLVRFIEEGVEEAEEKLYNYILSSVRNKKIDPLFLLYALNKGKRVPFNSDTENSLYNEKKYYEYLLYLVLTDKNIIEDLLLLEKIKIVVGEVFNKRSSATALALLFNRMIEENIELLRRG